MRKCANSTPNSGLLAIRTAPFIAVVAPKPMFSSAIWTVNSAPIPSSAGHSPRSGRIGMRARRAHANTHREPSAKRRNPLQSGGKASSPSFTATGFAPHSV